MMEPFLWIERAFESDIEFAFGTLTLQHGNELHCYSNLFSLTCVERKDSVRGSSF